MAAKKIFIVDDEEEIRESLSRKLISDGFEVSTAATGTEAVRMVKNADFDLLLVDIVLPDIDGPDVVQQIRQDPAQTEVPVIFFSGIVSKEESGKYSEIKAGGQDYPAIGKPFAYEDLIKMITRYI